MDSSSFSRQAYGLMVALVLVVSLGCHRRFVDKSPVEVSPSVVPVGPTLRVLVLPVANESGFPEAGDFASRLVSNEMFQIPTFDTVIPHSLPIDGHCAFRPDQQLEWQKLLVHAHRQFQCDAVLITRLKEFHPYWPPRISIQAQLVNAKDGEILRSAQGAFDAGQATVAQNARRYFQHMSVGTDTGAHDLLLYSPQHFGTYAVSQVLRGLVTPPHAAVEWSPPNYTDENNSPNEVAGTADDNGLDMQNDFEEIALPPEPIMP